jgi:S1-C subfamily serine protease
VEASSSDTSAIQGWRLSKLRHVLFCVALTVCPLAVTAVPSGAEEWHFLMRDSAASWFYGHREAPPYSESLSLWTKTEFAGPRSDPVYGQYSIVLSENIIDCTEKRIAKKQTLAKTATGGIAFSEIVPDASLAFEVPPPGSPLGKLLDLECSSESRTIRSQAARPDPQRRTNSYGSGFVVARAGYVLTNTTVVAGCTTIKILGSLGAPGGRRLSTPAKVLAADGTIGLALLKTDYQFSATACLRTGRTLETGEKVLVLTYPPPDSLTIDVLQAWGSVWSLSGLLGDTKQASFAIFISREASGGPVLDASGLVVGVLLDPVEAKLRARSSGQVLIDSLAIKADVVREFLDRQGVQPCVSSTETRSNNLVWLGRSFTVQVECTKTPLTP